jgi:hypothetical protein
MTVPAAAETAPFVYLATPAYGGVVNMFYLSSILALASACEQRGVGLHVEVLSGDTQITRARARLAARFLAHPKATHLLFVDADIGFAPTNVFRLLDAARPVVGGVCPLKSIEWEKVRNAVKAGVSDLLAASVGYVVRFIPTPDSSVEVENGVAKVAYCGTGFLMIAREAAQRITEAHPELGAALGDLEPDQPTTVMMFDTMIEPETRQYLSEDYAFCRRWTDLGGEIWADMEGRLTHVGHAAYSGSLIEAMRRG